MATTVGRAVLELTTDSSGFNTGLADVEKSASARLGKIGAQFSSVGANMTKFVTLPIAAIGAGLVAIGTQFDSALNTIRAGTGATGADLKALGESFRNVWGTGAEGADVVSSALADLQTRTGLVGEPLEALTRQMLNLADIAKTDVGPLIASTTRMFGDWSIATEKQGDSLDFLWKTSQTTGIAVDSLAEKLVQFGAPLRQLGFSFEESAALMGKWEKEGVNTEKILSSLSIGVGRLAKEGIAAADMGAVFRERLEGIGTSASPVTAAIELFGAKAGPDLAAAVIEGRFSVDALMASLDASAETINQADADTESLAEQFGTLKNQASSALAPVGIQLVQAIERVMPQIAALAQKLADAAKWFSELPAPVQNAALVIAGVFAAAGPIMSAVGMFATTLGALIKTGGAIGSFVSFLSAGGPLMATLATLGKALLAFAMGPAAPFVLIGVAVAGLAVVIYKNWDEIKAATATFLKWIGEKFSAFVGFYRDLWLGPNGIISTAKAVYEGVKTWLVDKFQAIVDAVKQKIEAVTGFFKNMYDKVVGNSYVPDMIDGIGSQFRRLDAVMVSPASEATKGVEGLFQSMGKSIDGLMGGVLDGIGGRFGSFLKSSLPSFGSSLSGALSGIMGNLSSMMTGGMSSLINMGLSMAIEGAKKIGSAISGLFKSEETKHVNNPRDQFFEQFGNFDGLAAKLGAKVDGGTAEQLIKALFDADTKQSFSSAQDAIIALVGGQKFAKGGIAMRPLIGQIAEAGPEAIVPLDRFEQMLSRGGQDVHVYIQTDTDWLRVTNKVVRHMPRSLSHAGLV